MPVTMMSIGAGMDSPAVMPPSTQEASSVVTGIAIMLESDDVRCEFADASRFGGKRIQTWAACA